eukprot:1001312_1
MFSSISLYFLMFRVASTNNCASYYEGPIHVALNQDIGTMEMLETLEISFDLKINAECLNTEYSWCHLFAIGGRGGRLPLLYTFSGQFVSHFKSGSDCCYDCIREFYSTMIDGNYHTFHLKYTETERIIKFDNITYIHKDNVQNDMIQHLHRSHGISAVWGSDRQYATDATIKHLCINPKSNAISTTLETETTTTDVSDLSTTTHYNTDQSRATTDNIREMSTVSDVFTTEHTDKYNSHAMRTVGMMALVHYALAWEYGNVCDIKVIMMPKQKAK